MIKYFMQRGPGEQVYYGEKNEVGVDQLIQLTFVEKELITKTPAYRCDGTELVAFQVSLDSKTSDYNREDVAHFVYTLTSDKKNRRVNSIDDEFIIDKVIDVCQHPNIGEVISRLNKTVWN